MILYKWTEVAKKRIQRFVCKKPVTHKTGLALYLHWESELECAIASSWEHYRKPVEITIAIVRTATTESKISDRPVVANSYRGYIQPEIQCSLYKQMSVG